MSMIVEVALNVPLAQVFDYRWKDEFPEPPMLGQRVVVPFGRQLKSGIVTAIKDSSSFSKLRRIQELPDPKPIFSEELLALTQWVSEYYLCAWGEVLNAALPGGLGIKLEYVYEKQASFPEDKILFLSQPLQSLVHTNHQWSDKLWKQHQPTISDYAWLTRMQKEKLLLKLPKWAGLKSKPKMERWVRLTEDADLDVRHFQKRRLTKKQKILQLFLQQQEWRTAEIKDHVPTPSQPLKQLVDEGLLERFERRVYRRFMPSKQAAAEAFQNLTPDQQVAFDTLQPSIQNQAYQTYLLQGVTGSGKTEVYLHAVRETLAQGRNCLVLVPEIALTPQLVQRFSARFGNEIAVLHSGMDDGERFDEWSKVLEQQATIVIGARSAVFAPLVNIGLIVVDEEHDDSYKQGETPRYHGRDMAILRGFRNNATVILGSATPSMESKHNVALGKYELLLLPNRAQQSVLPEVHLLDLKNVGRQKGSYFFSNILVEAMRQRLLQKEQSLLFLNRRGYAALAQCQVCDTKMVCENCSLCMVYHQSSGVLKCHQCDYVTPLPKQCPSCSARAIQVLGVGTEQIEEELKVIFPTARLLRMDRDTLHGKHAMSQMLEKIRNHEVDIVIGTQLVTKGHDFPNITLVGVIFADLSLNFPDFRSSERTFQLLTQVAGRAGRGEKPGEVFIQTHNPRHHSIVCAQQHDYEQFCTGELEMRQKLQVPPYTSMAQLVFSSPNEKRAEDLALLFHENLMPVSSDIRVMGPMEAPIKKIKNRFRWVILLKAAHANLLRSAIQQALKGPKPWSLRNDDRLTLDVDPHHLM